MEQIIYGDILFLVNFSMDFLALYITGKIMHLKQKTVTHIIAAAIGAAYAVADVFYSGNSVIGTLLHISVSCLMCYIVFGTGGIVFFFRSLLLFWAVSFTLGGTMTALFNLINLRRGHVFMNGNITEIYSEIPFLWIIIAAVLSGIISVASGRLFKRKSIEKDITVIAEFEGRRIEFQCMCDSGNLLREPVTGRPVIITGYSTLYPLLPPELHYAFKRKNTAALSNIDMKYMKHVRIIPISAVGHCGILLGFIPDKIIINNVERDACIAIDDILKPAAGKNNYNGFAAIIPAVLVN